jgi:uncharacterized protein YbjQ (UPF0145 family)
MLCYLRMGASTAGGQGNMKTKDIASKYGIDHAQFELWLKSTSSIPYKNNLIGGTSIDNDSYIDEAVNKFQQNLIEHEARLARESAEKERAAQQDAIAFHRMQAALDSIIITSGFNFEGYKIIKYAGYISGDDAVQVDRGREGLFFSSVADVGESLMVSLASIRRQALSELKMNAYALGCNAVIGLDFDYLTLDPETVNSNGGTLYLPYVFGVTANGNAVIIETI